VLLVVTIAAAAMEWIRLSLQDIIDVDRNTSARRLCTGRPGFQPRWHSSAIGFA
jgi:hypothetical protein